MTSYLVTYTFINEHDVPEMGGQLADSYMALRTLVADLKKRPDVDVDSICTWRSFPLE